MILAVVTVYSRQIHEQLGIVDGSWIYLSITFLFLVSLGVLPILFSSDIRVELKILKWYSPTKMSLAVIALYDIWVIIKLYYFLMSTDL